MKSFLKQIIIVFTLFTIATLPCVAGKYVQENYSQNTINHHLTLEKIRTWEYNAFNKNDEISLNKLRYYSGQTVFWRGYVNNFQGDGPYSFTLKTGSEEIWVYCNEKTLNIDVDRTGCKVGVKGKLVIEDDRFMYIEGKSVVLMIPPPGQQFADFQRKYKIDTKFTLNTDRGIIEMEDDFYPFVIYWVLFHNPGYDLYFAETVAKATIYYSHKFQVDPRLCLSLFTIESAMDYNVISPAGAIGFGQLMPGTAAGLGVDPYDAFQNVGGSIKLFKGLLDEWSPYENSLDLALASYNAGSGAVYSYGGIPPYSETQNYVFFIKFMYNHMKNTAI